MATASHKVKVRLEAEDKASGEIAKVDRSIGGLAKSISAGFVAAVAAAAVAVGVLVKGFKSITSAASVQEDAITKLDASLASLGPTAKGVSERLQEQAAALQKLTRVGDETIIQGQALIASFTKDEEAIKKATVAALDLSAATGQSLQSAFLLLGRAAKGETSTLTRYGIILDESLEKSEKFAAAIAAINEQWGGQAQAQAKTFSGLVQQISNAYGDLQEQLGFAFTKNEELLGSMTKLRDLLSSGDLVTFIDRAATATSGFTTATIEETKAIRAVATGLSAVSELFGLFIDVVNGTSSATRQLKGDTDGLIHSLDGVASLVVGKVLGPLKEYGALLIANEKAGRDTEAINNAMAASFEEQVKSILKTGQSVENLKERFEELTAAQNDEIASSDAYQDTLKRLGVVLESSVNAEIERNNAFLLKQGELLRAGEIDARDYERSQIAVAEANAKATESLGDHNDALDESSDSYASAKEGAALYGIELETLAETTRRLAAEEAAAAAARSSGGGSSFGGTTSGGSKLFPNSALANTAYRGGVAVDVRAKNFYN